VRIDDDVRSGTLLAAIAKGVGEGAWSGHPGLQQKQTYRRSSYLGKRRHNVFRTLPEGSFLAFDPPKIGRVKSKGRALDRRYSETLDAKT
jgi:hypothetical protein